MSGIMSEEEKKQYKGYSIEHFVRVYDDKTGGYVQIGPDSDGLNLIEIGAWDNEGERITSFSLSKRYFEKVLDAASQWLNNRRND
jgi:hypothetical protein